MTVMSLGPHLEAEYMQIDTTRDRNLTPEEKKTLYGINIMFVLRRRRPQGYKLPQEVEPTHY